MRSWYIDERERTLFFKFEPGLFIDTFDTIHPKVNLGLREGRVHWVKVLIGPETSDCLGEIEMALSHAEALGGAGPEIFQILQQTDCGMHPEQASFPPARLPRKPLTRNGPPRPVGMPPRRRPGVDRPQQVREPLNLFDTWWLANRPIHGVTDQIKRYCGLEWSGGRPETFAFQYYDALPHEPGAPLGPLDLVACVALQPTIVPNELIWFHEQGFQRLDSWVTELPPDLDLADADESTIRHLCELPGLTDETPLALLSKVAHRLRPRLIPLYEGTVGAHYRLITGSRGESSWPDLLPALRDDLRGNFKEMNQTRNEIHDQLGPLTPSPLRLLDIALYMENREFAELRRR
jgi:hypothetical protein